MVDQSIYNSVLDLACELVNSSSAELTQNYWHAYQKLNELCELHKGTSKDHPLQWEALADYTRNIEQALNIYLIAIEVATNLNLSEYVASSQFAVAERFLEAGNKSEAITWASRADENARTCSNLELRKEISEFLLESAETHKRF
ncbi:hypothetical protein N7931_10835 [Catenovulum sp. 2E275]|uniref:hypothetical protein n=1 Tax=Catenovulum sp. 2E275 TaxID=2980497 RepID=UPI0021D37707|nr:hypothetical protein [Catenovulum sp. 2E275]MCU4676124.1 hypothetical protein [Catenovulum sp. 2E275]